MEHTKVKTERDLPQNYMCNKECTICAIPAGATIKQQLAYREMSIEQFQVLMEMSREQIDALISGRIALTHEIAERLQAVFGVSSQFWEALEARYRAKLAIIDNN